jgi:hypothetical protein
MEKHQVIHKGNDEWECNQCPQKYALITLPNGNRRFKITVRGDVSVIHTGSSCGIEGLNKPEMDADMQKQMTWEWH